MTEFGKRGVELLKEIMNHDQTSLSAYNEEQVRLVISEVDEHQAQMQRIISLHAASDSQDEPSTNDLQQNPADAVALVVHVESITRNKQLLLAYMLQRVERLKNIRWNQRSLPPTVAEACSPQEVEFYRSYDRILTKYTSKMEGIGHDLTLDTSPPKDLNMHVRVLQDAGNQLFSFGQMTLCKGDMLHLPADEAEPLIKLGVLQPVKKAEFL